MAMSIFLPFLASLAIFLAPLLAQTSDSEKSDPADTKAPATIVTPFDITDLRDFDDNPPAVRALIGNAFR